MRNKIPALNRSGYIVDDIGHLVKVEKGRGRRLPRKMVLAALARFEANRTPDELEPLPF